MKMTKHALARVQQRGLRQEFIDLILEYGTPKYRPGDVLEYKITKKEKSKLITHLKRLTKAVENSSNKAVLVNSHEDSIITAYHIL